MVGGRGSRQLAEIGGIYLEDRKVGPARRSPPADFPYPQGVAMK
jgi:hypothetical protein